MVGGNPYRRIFSLLWDYFRSLSCFYGYCGSVVFVLDFIFVLVFVNVILFLFSFFPRFCKYFRFNFVFVNGSNVFSLTDIFVNEYNTARV